MELETVIVSLHDCLGDERGFVEIPASWRLQAGDVLADNEGRAVRVLSLVALDECSPIAALVKVAPAPALARG